MRVAASASTLEVRTSPHPVCMCSLLESFPGWAAASIASLQMQRLHPDNASHRVGPILQLSAHRLCAGDNDATVILKPAPGSRRWQHVTTEVQALAAPVQRQTESNYTIILGSHRNTCLKVEKDGQLCEAVWFIVVQPHVCPCLATRYATKSP